MVDRLTQLLPAVQLPPAMDRQRASPPLPAPQGPAQRAQSEHASELVARAASV